MTQRFRIDGAEYDGGTRSPEGQALVERLQFVQGRLMELGNQMALLNKAKNAYIADLKVDFVRSRTGIYLDGFLDRD